MRAANVTYPYPKEPFLRPLPHPETIFLLDEDGASAWAEIKAGAVSSDVKLMPFKELTHQALVALSPRTIVTPAIRNGFDAIEVATRLEAARYGGVLVVATNPDLDNALVEREVRNTCPSVRCTFMQMLASD